MEQLLLALGVCKHLSLKSETQGCYYCKEVTRLSRKNKFFKFHKIPAHHQTSPNTKGTTCKDSLSISSNTIDSQSQEVENPTDFDGEWVLTGLTLQKLLNIHLSNTTVASDV